MAKVKAKPTYYKMKLKKGDNVKVMVGKDKGHVGKILMIDHKKNRVLVQGANMITKHQKANAAHPQGGLIKKEAFIHASNVMYMHDGKPVKLGYKVEFVEKDGKKVKVKTRIAKPSGESVD